MSSTPAASCTSTNATSSLTVHIRAWTNIHPGTLRLTGLVDGERYLFGDPLIDLVSPVLFARIEDEPGHPFPVGYAEALGAAIRFDPAARRRLALYRMHLYLLTTVEMPSRGMTPRPQRHRLLRRLLSEELAELSRPHER